MASDEPIVFTDDLRGGDAVTPHLPGTAPCHNNECDQAPRVSVVIPTYRHGSFVLETLDSVFSQTFEDYEVIVVNDGSPDNTDAVLRSLVEAGRIRYLKQPNAGQAAARNSGMRLAKGEYIALLDDDDLWPPCKLAWQVKVLDSDQHLGAVAGVAEFINEAGRATARGQFVAQLECDRLFEGNPIMSPGQVLIRKSLLCEIGGFDTSIWGADDWQLWFDISRRRPFVMHDRIALKYRIHAGNATNQARRLFDGCRMVLEKQLRSLDNADRQRNRRAAYRALYMGWGPRFVQDVKQDLRNRRWKSASAAMGGIVSLLAGVGAEPRLLWWLLRNFFPSRFGRRGTPNI